MRIIAGDLKGTRITAPKGRPLRPTSDRVKEALFSIISAEVHGIRFLDLFAGTGSIGIEALSRGAQHAWFVEENFKHLGFLRKNVEKCHLMSKTTIIKSDVESFIKDPFLKRKHFDIIFMDPPYFDASLDNILDHPKLHSLLKKKGVIIAEHFHKVSLKDKYLSLKKTKEYHYGDSFLTFFR